MEINVKPKLPYCSKELKKDTNANLAKVKKGCWEGGEGGVGSMQYNMIQRNRMQTTTYCISHKSLKTN